MSTIIQQLIDEDGNNLIPIAGTSSTYNSSGISVDVLFSSLQGEVDTLEGLSGSNFVGIQDTTSAAQTECSTLGYPIGWALIGTNLSGLTAYRVTSSTSTQIGDTVYDFTDYSDAVKTTSQSLTDVEKEQARTNINAANADDLTDLAQKVSGVEQYTGLYSIELISAQDSHFTSIKIPIKKGYTYKFTKEGTFVTTTIKTMSSDSVYDESAVVETIATKNFSGSIEFTANADALYVAVYFAEKNNTIEITCESAILKPIEEQLTYLNEVVIPLVALSVPSESSSWVVGTYYNSSTKLLRHYDGSAWSTIPYISGAIYSCEGHLYWWNGTGLKYYKDESVTTKVATINNDLYTTEEEEYKVVDGVENGIFSIPNSGIRANSSSEDFGQVVSFSGSSFNVCDYIEYIKGTEIKIFFASGFDSFGIVFYDEDYTPISGRIFANADVNTEISVSSETAAYFRSSMPSGTGAYFKYTMNEAKNRIEKIDYCYENSWKSKWNGKTILFCGTSIPAGAGGDATGYPRAVGKILGATIINKAVGASVVRKSKRDGSAMNDTNQQKSFSQTKAEKEAMFGSTSYDIYSYESLLLPYLDASNDFPDLIVLDYSSDGGADEGYSDDRLSALNENASDKESLGTDSLARTLNLNRCTMTGALNYIIDLIYQYNPQARIMLMGYQNRQLRPKAMDGQKNVADYWQIPYFPVSDVLGWSQNVLYGSMDKFNSKYATLISAGTITAATEDVTAMRYWCPDGIHPHTNTTMSTECTTERESNYEIAKKVAEFIESIN